MATYNVQLTYVDHADVHVAAVEAEIWQAAVRQAIRRYSRWGLPTTAHYSLGDADRPMNVEIEGSMGDYRLIAAASDEPRP